MRESLKQGQVHDPVSGKTVTAGSFHPGVVSSDEWRAICRALILAKNSQYSAYDMNTRSTIVEVGTLAGKTTHAIMRFLNAFQWPNVTLLTIDKDPSCRSVLDNPPKTGRVHVFLDFFHGTAEECLRKEVPSVERSPLISSDCLPPVRFAFVDGCHCEDCVRADIRAIVPFMKHGAVFAFHDAASQRSLGMLVHERYHNDGVPRKYGVTEVIDSEQGGLLCNFNRVEVVPPTVRPRGSPTLIKGGLQVWQKQS